MYSIILVDDEDEVREGIKYKTPWSACGFELAGDFDNGRDALDAMDRLKPDVVITDISMPYMDGLALARNIREQYRGVKVVIVTGYENFDYAQQAIRVQVSDYLLKPLNLEQFTQFLCTMKAELDEERRRREDLSQLRSRLHQSLPLLKERFLEKLAASSIAPSEMEPGLREFGIVMPGPLYIAMISDIDGGSGVGQPTDPSGRELVQFGLYNVMQEIVEQENGGVVFRTRDGKAAGLLSGGPTVGTLTQKLAEYIRESAGKYLKLMVSVGIGRACGGLEELPRSYQEALAALDYRFLLGMGRTLSIQDMESGSPPADSNGSDDWGKALISAMRSGSRAKVSEAIDAGIERLKTTFTGGSSGYAAVHRALAALRHWVAETGLAEPAVLADESVAAVDRMRTLDEIRAWLEAACHVILQDLSTQRSDVARSQMQLAEQFIREYYSNENLSLTDCCNHLHISISYFSMLFKQHTGATFVEYLTRIRIGKAKELLTLTPHKTYEIALRVGYADPHYFSVIFKRHTSFTPKEYRALQKGKS